MKRHHAFWRQALAVAAIVCAGCEEGAEGTDDGAVELTDAGRGSECSVGTPACSCTPGGGCDPGLECRSGRCILSPSPRDGGGVCDVTELVLGANRGTTTGCGAETQTHCGGDGPERFFSFSLYEPSVVSLFVEADGWDPAVEVREGPCDGAGGGAWLTCAEGTCSVDSAGLADTFAAGNYCVVVDGFNANDTGDFTLTYERSPSCGAQLTWIPGPGYVWSGDTSSEPDLADGCFEDDWAPDQFYVVSLCPGSGTISATTCGGASWDTELAIRRGSCAGDSVVVCNDDADGCGVQSAVQAGISHDGIGLYFIQVTGFAGSSGPYSVLIDF